VKFAFIAVEKAFFPITALCKVLQVSRSGFYDWVSRDVSAHTCEDDRLRVRIAAIFESSNRLYGSPRIHRELRAEGISVSRKRVARLMVEMNLRSRRKRRFRATTDSNHTLPIAENVLQRKFEVDAPDVAWVTDITYVWTSEGWLYLAAILDLFSRRVVGFAMSERIDRELTLNALLMAVGRRCPNAGLVHHSDRGSQYASHDYQRALTNQGATCSMSRKGNCWDNAVAESFFATLKTECVYLTKFETREDAKRVIFDYLGFYNHRRRHSTLGYVSPVEFENRFVLKMKQAA
jgi:transposase InsO family protein